MRRVILLGAVVLALATAGTASAKPSYGGRCSSCHSLSGFVSVTVNEVATDNSQTTYRYAITGQFAGGFGYGVFDVAGNKVASGSAATGQFTIANGAAYTFYGVNKDRSSMAGYASTTLSPAGPTATPAPTATPTASPTPTGTPMPPATRTATPRAMPSASPSPPAAAHGHKKMEGTLERIAGAAWTISGVTITVGEDTKVKGEPTIGAPVEVKVVVMPGGGLLAKKIEIESRDEDDDEEAEDKRTKGGDDKDKDRDEPAEGDDDADRDERGRERHENKRDTAVLPRSKRERRDGEREDRSATKERASDELQNRIAHMLSD